MKKIQLLAVVLFASTASFAQNKDAKIVATPTQSAPALQTPAAPQTPSQLKWEKETHDFGTIEKGKPVSYEFVFTNTTGKDVTIKDVKASCGCTSPNWTKTVVKAGEKGSVTATFNAAAQGPFQKQVTVYSSEENTQPKVLFIKGNIPVDQAPAATPVGK